MLTIAGWIVLGPVGGTLVTFVAGRLLGSRRGWLSLLIAGAVGFVAAVLSSGALTRWDWDGLDMVLLSLGLGIVFTMAAAIALDLVAPMGTLARGEAAGLVAIRNPVEGARRTLRPFRRYREVLGLARQNGVVRRRVAADSLPGGVRRTLEQAGGIFVKLGQVASTRTDVLPRAWCDELAELRSAAAPAAEDAMRPHITSLLGQDPERSYASFDWTPIASASISQVYRATLPDGADVIVKVQRPGLDEVVELDSAAIMQIARVIERRTPLGLSVRPAELAEEFIDGVRQELDFTIEAGNAEALRVGLGGVVGVRIPVTYPDLSGPQILTQELIDAPNVGELEASGMPLAERRALAERLVALFMHQVFDAGVFHCDPHPGNVLLEPDGTIVLIDLGAVGRLGTAQRSAVLEMLVAAATGDAAGLRHAIGRITTYDRRVDLRALESSMELFLARHLRAGGGISVAAFEDLAVLTGRFGLRLPRWFGTLCRTLVTLEGTLRCLDPSYSLVDAATAHAGNAIGVGRGVDLRTLLEREAVGQLSRLRRLPEHLDDILAQAATGRLSAQLSLLADERDERLVTRLVDRVVLGLIAAATSLASVLLIDVDAGPDLGGSVTLNEVLGYFGLGASAVLAFRVVAGIIRDGET